MKKSGVWNARLASVIASCGHGKNLVICDAGFPVPDGVELIDLAVTRGLPRFLDVLHAVLEELVVEEYTVCDQMAEINKEDYSAVRAILDRQPCAETDMDEIITKAKHSTACIRTGEDRPYCNIVLTSASGVAKFAEKFAIGFEKGGQGG